LPSKSLCTLRTFIIKHQFYFIVFFGARIEAGHGSAGLNLRVEKSGFAASFPTKTERLSATATLLASRSIYIAATVSL
jgi:hypothetical protein